MRQTVLIILISLLLLFGMQSCLPASQQEIQMLTTQVSNLLTNVDSLQEATKTLSENGIVDSEKIDKINEEIDRVQEHTELIVTEVGKAEDPVDAARKGWEASKDFNPYYTYGVIVIEALALLGLGKKNKDQKDALVEVVKGVENLKTNGGDVKKAMGEAQSLKTKNIVSLIRNKVA